MSGMLSLTQWLELQVLSLNDGSRFCQMKRDDAVALPCQSTTERRAGFI